MELKNSQNKQLTKEQLLVIKGGNNQSGLGNPIKNAAKCVLSGFRHC